MYFQKDYVLRMIEMMGELMRRICAISREVDARHELDEISQKACGMPIFMLKTGDPETLVNLMAEPQRFLAAELLLIDIEISKRTQTEDELLPLKLQILALLASLTEPDYMLPSCDHAAKIMEETLDEMPVDTLTHIAELFERGGQYAACEDALFAAYEIDPGVHPSILAFYNRLDHVTDAMLVAGGLSREEVEEGRQELQ